jgi:hypothetical protein
MAEQSTENLLKVSLFNRLKEWLIFRFEFPLFDSRFFLSRFLNHKNLSTGFIRTGLKKFVFLQPEIAFVMGSDIGDKEAIFIQNGNQPVPSSDIVFGAFSDAIFALFGHHSDFCRRTASLNQPDNDFIRFFGGNSPFFACLADVLQLLVEFGVSEYRPNQRSSLLSDKYQQKISYLSKL